MIKQAKVRLCGLLVAALAVSASACDAPSPTESGRAPTIRGTVTEMSSSPTVDVVPSISTSDSVGVSAAPDGQSVQYGAGGLPNTYSYTEFISGVTYDHFIVYGPHGEVLYHFIYDPSTGRMKVFHVINGVTVWEYWGAPVPYPIVIPAADPGQGMSGTSGGSLG